MTEDNKKLKIDLGALYIESITAKRLAGGPKTVDIYMKGRLPSGGALTLGTKYPESYQDCVEDPKNKDKNPVMAILHEYADRRKTVKVTIELEFPNKNKKDEKP